MNYELRSIDRHFARFMQRQAAVPSPWLELTAALVSAVTGDGHICLDLAGIAGRTVVVDGAEQALPALDELRHCLQRCGVVGAPGEYAPLVLDTHSRLYLYRYWEYERELATIIRTKATAVDGVLNGELLEKGVVRVFGDGGEGVDWQKVAAVAALRSRFCVISGGPGTGKTSTVVKILALLVEQAGEKPLRIALAAPTGKAAARLKESISAMKVKLECTETVRQLIPEKVITIHSLLGAIRGSIHFRHNASYPLPFDVVIIDEASMVALPLMAKLALALAGDARLILLGDRDQLASVEAGAVLGDICGNGREELFSGDFSALVTRTTGEAVPAPETEQPLPPLVDSLVILKKNYRFGTDSGIGILGRAVRDGQGELALQLCRGEGGGEVVWQDLPGEDGLKKALAETVVQGYRNFRTTNLPVEALSRLNEFRVLCALRQGPFGVGGMNLLIEGILEEAGLIDPRNRWYTGRPVMITVNDHNLKLYNGDVGIVLPESGTVGRPRVWFTTPEGTVRCISPLRLPAHETAWCMTVHKSQGSEFERVLLLLPPRDQEIITRELIYTGITRARRSVDIWGDAGVFAAAVARKIERTSGLEDALWESLR